MADWTCRQCMFSNPAEAEACAYCGTPRRTESAAKGSLKLYDHSAPAGAVHTLGGIAGGMVAAVIAAAAWTVLVAVTGTQFAVVAIGVGMLVSLGVLVGAGRRGSWLLVGVSVLLTLAALAISEYAVQYRLFTREFGGVELLQPLDAMLDIVVGSLQDDPQTLLFWVIGLLAATYLPYRAIPTEPGAE